MASTIGLSFNSLSAEPLAYYLAPPLDESLPTPNLASMLVSTAGEEESLGPIRVVAILVEFKNINHTISREEIKDRFLNDVSGYYREASNGNAWIVGDVAGWYSLKQTKSYYGRDGRMIDDPNFDGAIDSWWLIRDAVEAADPDVDFAEYDNVVVVHAGYGQETSRVSDDIWSVAYWGGLWIKTKTRSPYTEELYALRWRIVEPTPSELPATN